MPGVRRDGDGGGQGGVGHGCVLLCFFGIGRDAGGVPAYLSGAVSGGLYRTRRASTEVSQEHCKPLNAKEKIK
ncbi:protein of unknown function [Cupriavidus taiwanensis]|uniref:Uncharacterized protein n=1 Tax=Cupriavidus taiwanensis TaxID=164546 RepID=A0A9Q7XSX6_9BURK|nr:protein of unknown function [Cupriavidus taiwanensis]